jgi:hypothetical protein
MRLLFAIPFQAGGLHRPADAPGGSLDAGLDRLVGAGVAVFPRLLILAEPGGRLFDLFEKRPAIGRLIEVEMPVADDVA